MVKALLFVIIYIVPGVIALPALIEIINKLRAKYRAYRDWYNSLTPEEKIAEELNAIKWYMFFK